jgi:hypothetical protein
VESFLYQLLDTAGIKPNPEHFKQGVKVSFGKYRAASSLFVFFKVAEAAHEKRTKTTIDNFVTV